VHDGKGVYQDNRKDYYICDGRPDVNLSEGELKIGGTVVRSYVKSFDWNVYKKFNKTLK